jgi:hypothetical protein
MHVENSEIAIIDLADSAFNIKIVAFILAIELFASSFS